MKIYSLPVAPKLQPESQIIIYPKHNKDFGVEQDFHLYINQNKTLLTNNITEADWHFLPVYWTRWHLNHDYGRSGIDELQHEIDKSIIDDNKTFTICQYDDGPVVNIGNSVQFLASRKGSNGVDIPLLSSAHKKPFFRRKKKYLASFVGRIANHPIRQAMADALRDNKNVFIYDGDKGTNFFVKTTVSSYISLSPRGYGGSSFRFFEAMQLGVVPFLISDIDTRPFKKFINWDDLSLFTSSSHELERIFSTMRKEDLTAIGKLSNQFYMEKLAYQKWCQYVIKELGSLTC